MSYSATAKTTHQSLKRCVRVPYKMVVRKPSFHSATPDLKTWYSLASTHATTTELPHIYIPLNKPLLSRILGEVMTRRIAGNSIKRPWLGQFRIWASICHFTLTISDLRYSSTLVMPWTIWETKPFCLLRYSCKVEIYQHSFSRSK